MLEQAPSLSKECLDYAKGTQYTVVSIKCDSESFQVEFYDIENDLSIRLYRYVDGWYQLAKKYCHPAITKDVRVQFDDLHDAVSYCSDMLLTLRNEGIYEHRYID